MAAADWEEVKRLAADFQRAQLSSTIQRLSERNCIEIIRKLIDFKLVDVIYTTDGKEYITPQELWKEIREELEVHGGRVNLVELQRVINVDLSHIQTKANEVVQSDKNLVLILGQIIDKSYLDRIGEEINDKLQDDGQITIAELTKTYHLPGDFLQKVVEERLGTLIYGKQDEYDRGVIFTETFVARHRARIRGAFTAVTRPITLSQVMNQYNFPERLFYTVLEDLVSKGRLAGSISGGRQDKATFVPDIYTKSQNNWVDSFYKQNGYLEYDGLTRLGISDPKTFIKKRFKSEKMMFLTTCMVGHDMQEQLEAAVDDMLSSEAWIDVLPLLPSILSTKDASQILQNILKGKKDFVILCDTVVVNNKFITNCKDFFTDLMNKRANKDSKMNAVLFSPEGDKQDKVAFKPVVTDEGHTKEDRKDQRKKKAAGTSKSGGGLQGREVKMKATKNKYRGRGGHDEGASDDETTASSSGGRGNNQQEIEFMSVDGITNVLTEKLQDCSADMMVEIAQHLYRPLKREYQDVAKSIFLHTTGTASSEERRKTHGELQDKVNGLWTNLKLFEKGTVLLSGDTETQVYRHLLRTICTDITNLAMNAVATDNMMSLSEDTVWTAEMRTKIISKIPDPTQAKMIKLNSSLTEKTLEEFNNSLEEVCDQMCLGILLKKPDKKKERQLIFNHRQALVDQLRSEEDAAMTLHLATTLLFQIFTQNVVNISGRCVPQLVTFLKEYIPKEQHDVLVQCQDMVVKQMKKSESDSEDDQSLLTEVLHKVKEMALTAKRGAAQDKEAA